jgi:hypothetical protein
MNTAADVMNSDSDADVTNTALLGPGGPSGPEEKSVQLPSLRSLAAARFLEFVVASIRGEVDPTAAEITQMQVAGTILRELAPLSGPGLDDLDGLDGLSNKRTAPRPRPVDSTLPKGFPGTCGPGNHAITYKPMLLLEIKRGRDTRLASIVSNEAYGSGPISMFTAAGAAVKLVKEQAKRGGMVIFASPVHAEQANGNMDAWWGVLRRVLRMLHEVGLTAEQQNTDALVIAPVVRKDKRQLEAMSLLYLINATGPQRLARREAGLKNFR